MRPVRFNVIASVPHSPAAWRDLARKVADLGFAALLVPDHLDEPSPFPALVAAAAATSRLRVGTRVLNAGLVDAPLLARDAATVSALTDGRLELGVGSGWRRDEFEAVGRPFGPPRERARHLAATLAEIKRLWARHAVEPVARPPIVVGGHSDAILAVAAEHGDGVCFPGARLVRDRWRPAGLLPADLAERIDLLRRLAGGRAEDIEIGVRVRVVLTDGAADLLARALATATGVPAPILAASPYALLGTVEDIVDKVLRMRAELGVTVYDVDAAAVDDLAAVVARLAS